MYCLLYTKCFRIFLFVCCVLSIVFWIFTDWSFHPFPLFKLFSFFAQWQIYFAWFHFWYLCWFLSWSLCYQLLFTFFQTCYPVHLRTNPRRFENHTIVNYSRNPPTQSLRRNQSRVGVSRSSSSWEWCWISIILLRINRESGFHYSCSVHRHFHTFSSFY